MSASARSRRLVERLVINPDEPAPAPPVEQDATSRPPQHGVPTASIAHNPRNPRGADDDVDELAASLQQVGVLQPLGVVSADVFLAHYPEHEPHIAGYEWVVVTGNRRLTAARRVRLVEVPVHVLDALGQGEQQFDEAALIENIHREALPPLREAAALELLVRRHGSQRKTATRIGVSQGFVSQRLSLLKLPATLRAALENRTLTVEVARAIAVLPPEEQQRVADAGPPYTMPDPAAREATGKKRRGRPSASVMVIRVTAGAPDRLAAALRDKLSREDLAELVRMLSAE